MTESRTTEQQSEKPDVHSFGERLYAARTSQGLSTEDVADSVNLTVEMVEAIERSDVNKLPQPTFVQGYIRVIARHLGVPEDTVLDEYSRAVPHVRETQLRPRSVLPDETNSGSPFVRIVSMILLIAVIFAAIYGFYSYYSEMADTMSPGTVDTNDSLDIPYQEFSGDEQIDSQVEYEIHPEQTEASLEEAETDVSILENELVTAQQQQTEQSQIEAVQTQQAEPADNVVLTESQQAAEGDDVIVLAARRSSWVEVVDSNDVKLYYDLLQENRSLVLRGQAPFDVFLGNAPAMVVKLNDIPINMTKYVRSNNIAHFSVSVQDGQVVFH